MDKLISVVIPTFNRKELTDRAIQSVVSAFPELIEIIAVDDSSLIPYSFGHDVNISLIPVYVIRLQTNVGAGMARRAGVELAKGQFIAFLDSDDCYDKSWMDYVIRELRVIPHVESHRIFMSGIANGERRVGAMIREIASQAPTTLRVTALRLINILFNPFCTPSIVAHRDLCSFKDGLRYCEDYYSTSIAIFRADKIILPNVLACHLGREPSSVGGLSSSCTRMYEGEMEVRYAMLHLPCIPLQYKVLIPVGIMYQVVRTIMKRFLV